MSQLSLFVTGSLALTMCLVASAGYAQGVTEWSSDTRTVLSFHVPDAAVQKLLPAGWTVDPSTGPTNRGANLTLIVMERMVITDPQGKPLKTGSSRYTVIAVPAKHAQTGQTNTVIVSGISPEGAGAYGVYETATVSKVERTSSGDGEENGRARESWEFASAGGDRIALALSYRRAAATRSRVETHLRSARNPAFTRTYRLEQAADLVKSTVTGVNRVDDFTFRASGPHLSALFDGTETLLSVTVMPSYVREISLP